MKNVLNKLFNMLIHIIKYTHLIWFDDLETVFSFSYISKQYNNILNSTVIH